MLVVLQKLHACCVALYDCIHQLHTVPPQPVRTITSSYTSSIKRPQRLRSTLPPPAIGCSANHCTRHVHPRRSSGCGDVSCTLCQYNPSRICKRNLKAKYLIDDHLRAKCGAGLRVEVVDEAGQCCEDGLPDVQLEVGTEQRRACVACLLLMPCQTAANPACVCRFAASNAGSCSLNDMCWHPACSCLPSWDKAAEVVTIVFDRRICHRLLARHVN